MSPEEVAAAVAEVRERVRQRHAKTVEDIYDFELPTLDPLGQARDVADSKTAAIGTVNPRPPGLLNSLLQALKRIVARSLNWLLREQIEFNQSAISYMDRNIEAMVEQNYNLLRIAREFTEFRRSADERLKKAETMGEGLRADLQAAAATRAELSEVQNDILKHWRQWRAGWEERLSRTEIRFLHFLRDIEARARIDRERFEHEAERLHENYLESLSGATAAIQQRFWADLDKLRAAQERQIHTELRLIRRRAEGTPTQPAVVAPRPEAVPFDYARFEERFRGSEEYISQNQSFYLDIFERCSNVVDLGCGRGEFLALLQKRGVQAVGVDSDATAVAACREKGLQVAEADIFAFLREQPTQAFDGVLCAHVVEHLPFAKLVELLDLIHAKLVPDGIVAIETPNASCLAIYARDFYLDPTHVKPVPAAQLGFLLEEAGFGQMQTHERHAAPEEHPELAELDALPELRAFRKKFFGGLDIAITARKIEP